MEYWNFLEISEIEDLLEKPEHRYSVDSNSESDDNNYSLCNIAVALSPHLSEEAEQKPSPIKISEKKNTCIQIRKKKIEVSARVGTLSYEERQTKLQRYREKKKNRVWSKKINYNCRKKVAENRLRIKGRFVTKEQAIVLQKLSESCDINIS